MNVPGVKYTSHGPARTRLMTLDLFWGAWVW